MHLSRSTTCDGLNRSLTVSEQVASVSGTTSYNLQQSKYDDTAHVVSTSDRRGYVTTRKLDDLDRVFEEVVDDGSGLITRPSDGRSALQLKTQYQYDAAGNRRLTTDPLGRQTEEQHDALGRVIGRSLPMGVSESFGYDGEGHVISATDRRGITQTRRYDPVGRETSEELVEILSAGGASLTTLRRTYNDSPDSSGLTSLTEVDARNSATTHSFDGLHREVRTADAVNNAITVAFDAVNRREVRDRKGYRTSYQYDGVNRLTGQTEYQLNGTAVAFSQSTVYDDATRRQTAKDRRQIEAVSERDGLGRIERVTRGIQVTRTVYDGNGNAVQVTDPNSHVTFAVFDGAGRRISETRGSGSSVASTTTNQYDAAGNRTETKSARVIGVAYDIRETFDDLNRSVRTEDALGNVITRAFDGAGNKLCEKRPKGNAGGAGIAHGAAGGLSVDTLVSRICTGSYLTRYSYDELSKLTSVTDALAGQYSFVYDQARNLVAKQDANGSLTTYWYDALNRRRGEHQHLDTHSRLTAANRESVPLSEGMSDPLSNTGTFDWLHLYDENGNPQQTTDPKGQVETMTYGVLDRLESRSWANQPLPRELPALDSVAYLYDGNGNPTQVTEQKETSSGAVTEVTGRTFDNLDRLETETRYDGKVSRYGYDTKGNRTSVTDPDQVATTYTFDALDRLETATTPDGTATYRYWPDSLLRKVELPNGVQESRCYDAASRLTTIVTGQGVGSDTCATGLNTLSRYDYSYDENGNRLSQSEQRSDPATQLLGLAEQTTYGYDALDRLVGTKYGNEKAVLYRLDAVGNRTGEREAPVSAVTDLTAFDSVPSGELTHDITASFNRADWLLSRTDAKDPSRSATFRYDWNGNLTSKTTASLARTLRWDARNTLTAVFDNGTEVGRYDYDRDLQRVKRRTASENVEYVLDDHFVLQEASGATSSHPAYRRYHYAKQPLEVVDSGQGARFLSNDALGSVSDLTTTSGSLYAKRQYDAWGQYRNATAPAANQPKLGYTGHQFDPETGLVYARARYYDAESGVFLSRDAVEGTLSDAPSLHRYLYVRGNPLTRVDLFGTTDGSLDALLELLRTIASPPLPWQSPVVRQTAQVSREIVERGVAMNVALGEGIVIGAAAPPVCSAAPLACVALMASGVHATPPTPFTVEEGARLTGFFIGGFAGGALMSPPSPTEALAVKSTRTPKTVQGAKQAAVTQVVESAGRTTAAVEGVPAGSTAGGPPLTVTVYRVEGAPNTRIMIGEAGDVAIQGDQTLFLNFGSRARAEEFLAKRVAQGMPEAALKSFEVPGTVLEELRATAVPEELARVFPESPVIVDVTKAPDQFGIRPGQLEELEDLILQGSGKIESPQGPSNE